MTRLPEPFIAQIRALLALAGLEDEIQLFMDSYEKRPRRGLRLNRLKIKNKEALLNLLDKIFEIEFERDARSQITPVSWSDDGFEYADGLAAGRSLAYRLGLYYIQEPSAMLPAQALGSQVGESVIDLCAAPGGKSARIAADLDGEGILVSNDISSSRGRILVRNLEQLGVSNCLVTAADPVDLAKRWSALFDRVLVDAPCSGEGMFRRDPKAIASWSEFEPTSILPVQRKILDAAYDLLKPGGTLVYSTCTFNRQENEEQIEALMARKSDLDLIDLRINVPDQAQLDSGISTLTSEIDFNAAARIWPWRSSGDGHFCALLRKRETQVADVDRGKQRSHPGRRKSISEADRELVSLFYRDILSEDGWNDMETKMKSRLRLDHGRVHLIPEHKLDLQGVHILKEGIYLGNIIEGKRENRFEAAHSMMLTLTASDFKAERSLRLVHSDIRVQKLLKGETIELKENEAQGLREAAKSPSRGYLAVLVEGLPLCWVKLDRSGILKNLYPAGWRQL